MLNSIKDLYKFYIYHPSNGLVEVFPYNSTMEWVWEKSNDASQAFTRLKLNTSLFFKKGDFDLLYGLDRSEYRCEKIYFDVHRNCDGLFSLYWSGYIALVDAKFDVSKCTVTTKIRQQDEYSCLLRDWTKEKDFIKGVPSLPEINLFVGTIEYASCESQQYYDQTIGDPNDYQIEDSCINTNEWFWVRNYTTGGTIVDYGQYAEYQFTIISEFAREKAIMPIVSGIPYTPPGYGWIWLSTDGLTNTYIRPITDVNYDSLSIKPIKNGRLLNDVIQFLINDCGLTYVSDFFSRNGDDSYPNNFAYEYAKEQYKNVVIWQKSDVKRQQRVITNSGGTTTTLEYESATKAIIKLKDLLQWMNTIYNVQWKIIGNTLRIEHYTFWHESHQNIIDLTGNSRIAGLYEYEYATDELPNSEKWSWMEESDSDFDGTPIYYNETCSYGDSEKEDEYSASKITTNIDYIINNKDKISDSGFVLASVYHKSFVNIDEYTILSDICRISNKSKINGSHSFANLLYYLHRHNRPSRYGNMNGVDEAFYFPRPNRYGPEILFPICCNDLDSFDTNFRIKTQLGWGSIKDAKLKEPNSLMTVKLLYE